MKSDWPIVQLKDVLPKNGYIRGPFGSALRRPEMQSEGVPVYEQQHAIYNIRSFRFFIDSKKYYELRRFTVQPDDLIISCSGTLGKVSQIQKEDPIGIISQALLLLRPDSNKIYPKYLYHFFASPKGYQSLLSVSSGSVQVNLSRREDIEKISFPLPPLSDQRAIADVLSALDDKIELNRKMNQTLEQLAQTLFDHYFKNNAKKNNWRTCKVGEVCSFEYGKSLKATDRLKGLIPVYGSNGQIGLHNEFLVQGPGIVVGRKGNPGTVAYVHTNFFPIDTTFYVVPKPEINLYWLYYSLKSLNLSKLSADSAVPGLNRNIAYMSELLIPPSELAESFEDLIKPIFKKLFCNDSENNTLSELRDTLLPKLMSGQVRVCPT